MFRQPESENPASVGALSGADDAGSSKPQHGEHTALFAALREALLDRRLSIADCRLYAALLAQPAHERDGVVTCRPSRVRLANDSGVHPQSIRRSTANLVENDYIAVTYGAGRSTNRFALLRIARGSAPVPGNNPAPGNKVAASDGTDALPLAGIPLGSAPAPSTGLTGSAPVPQLLKQPRAVARSRSCGDLERFAEFYQAYPRHEARSAAEKAWKALELDKIADKIIADVNDRVAAVDHWTVKKYIPLPSTYLRARRWEDEWRTDSTGAGLLPRDSRSDAELAAANAAELARFNMGDTL